MKIFKKCYFILLGLLLLSSMFFAFHLMENIKEANSKANEVIKVDQLVSNEENKVDYSFIKNQKMFLEIESLDMLQRVMQSDNNNYYLSHDNDGNYNRYGSITLDYRNNINKDKKLIIYGHNSTRVNPEFKKLEKYKDETFFKNHKDLKLIYENGSVENYSVFSLIIMPNKNSWHIKLDFKNDNEYMEHLNYFKENSLYFDENIKLNKNSKIVVLQTCNFDPSGTWLIVSAIKK